MPATQQASLSCLMGVDDHEWTTLALLVACQCRLHTGGEKSYAMATGEGPVCA